MDLIDNISAQTVLAFENPHRATFLLLNQIFIASFVNSAFWENSFKFTIRNKSSLAHSDILWAIIVAKSALIFWNYFETSLYNHSKGSLFFHIHLSQFLM